MNYYLYCYYIITMAASQYTSLYDFYLSKNIATPKDFIKLFSKVTDSDITVCMKLANTYFKGAKKHETDPSKYMISEESIHNSRKLRQEICAERGCRDFYELFEGPGGDDQLTHSGYYNIVINGKDTDEDDVIIGNEMYVRFVYILFLGDATPRYQSHLFTVFSIDDTWPRLSYDGIFYRDLTSNESESLTAEILDTLEGQIEFTHFYYCKYFMPNWNGTMFEATKDFIEMIGDDELHNFMSVTMPYWI